MVNKLESNSVPMLNFYTAQQLRILFVKEFTEKNRNLLDT